ncbi:hypothetical protein [Paraburkholderia guartelaensis]|uniref:Uncharacterized protein n=1 Tax=Paraburkholderia guartelaensis TaxID=2546446 RepID=A0ABU9SJH8_9BURK
MFYSECLFTWNENDRASTSVAKEAFHDIPGVLLDEMEDLIRHMSQAQIDASDIDQAGKPSAQLDGMGGVYCADCEVAPASPCDDSMELVSVP